MTTTKITAPATAGARTGLLKRTLEEAGYEVKVRSAPASHTSQSSAIFPLGDTDIEAVTAYLNGWFGVEIVTTSPAGFAFVTWDGLDAPS